MDIEKVLSLNDIGLKKVFSKFVSANRLHEMSTGINNSGPDYMTLQDAIRLAQVAELKLELVQIVTAFSASKQTVIVDSEKLSPFSINQLVYVEFLELLCRLTLAKFKGSESEPLDLSLKLNYTLVDFLKYAGERFKMPEEEYEKPFVDKDDDSTEEEVYTDGKNTKSGLE